MYRGTRDAKGQFDLGPAERVNEPDGKPVKLDGLGRETGRANLTVIDWDNDGSLDLLVGNVIENFDGLRWYRNTGTTKRWAMLRQPNIPLNHYHLVEPVDWDGDGKQTSSQEVRADGSIFIGSNENSRQLSCL